MDTWHLTDDELIIIAHASMDPIQKLRFICFLNVVRIMVDILCQKCFFLKWQMV